MLQETLDQLKKAYEILDSGDYYDEDNGISISCQRVTSVTVGQWTINLGGYDTGYEVLRNDDLVARINYEYREYEWFGDDDTRETILKVFEAGDFTCTNEEDLYDEDLDEDLDEDEDL